MNPKRDSRTSGLERIGIIIAIIIAGGVLLPPVITDSARAQGQGPDFIRGDVNSDGKVSLADAHFLLSWLFRSRMSSPCNSTCDANDDARLNIDDAFYIIADLLGNGPPPPAPYPAPGPDPTPGGSDLLGCDGYGGGVTLDDPAARLEILEAVAAGGSDRRAIITLGLSSSVPVGGFFAALSVDGGIFPERRRGILGTCNTFGCEPGEITDLSGALDERWADGSYRITDGKLRLAVLASRTTVAAIPPSAEVVPVLEIEVCLTRGTAAGSYALTLEEVEFVDEESGRSVPVAGAAGTLEVLSDFADGIGCGEPMPPPPPPPELNASFTLESVSASPGSSARVPFVMRADGAIQAYSFSADFDEGVLQCSDVEKIYRRLDGQRFGFENFFFNNANDTPGNGGTDEGFVGGAVVFSFTTDELYLPADTDNYVLALHFDVAPGIDVGSSTEISFLDGASLPGGEPLSNRLTAYAVGWSPDTANSFVLVGSTLNIIGEISVFRRGDADGSGTINLNDPVTTLNYLFLGGRNPSCFDAADADDDGRIDITDPIVTLNWLFLGARQLPPPVEEAGVDPTDDGLRCLTRDG